MRRRPISQHPWEDKENIKPPDKSVLATNADLVDNTWTRSLLFSQPLSSFDAEDELTKLFSEKARIFDDFDDFDLLVEDIPETKVKNTLLKSISTTKNLTDSKYPKDYSTLPPRQNYVHGISVSQESKNTPFTHSKHYSTNIDPDPVIEKILHDAKNSMRKAHPLPPEATVSDSSINTNSNMPTKQLYSDVVANQKVKNHPDIELTTIQRSKSSSSSSKNHASLRKGKELRPTSTSTSSKSLSSISTGRKESK